MEKIKEILKNKDEKQVFQELVQLELDSTNHTNLNYEIDKVCIFDDDSDIKFHVKDIKKSKEKVFINSTITIQDICSLFFPFDYILKNINGKVERIYYLKGSSERKYIIYFKEATTTTNLFKKPCIVHLIKFHVNFDVIYEFNYKDSYGNLIQKKISGIILANDFFFSVPVHETTWNELQRLYGIDTSPITFADSKILYSCALREYELVLPVAPNSSNFIITLEDLKFKFEKFEHNTCKFNLITEEPNINIKFSFFVQSKTYQLVFNGYHKWIKKLIPKKYTKLLNVDRLIIKGSIDTESKDIKLKDVSHWEGESDISIGDGKINFSKTTSSTIPFLKYACISFKNGIMTGDYGVGNWNEIFKTRTEIGIPKAYLKITKGHLDYENGLIILSGVSNPNIKEKYWIPFIAYYSPKNDTFEIIVDNVRVYPKDIRKYNSFYLDLAIHFKLQNY